MKIRQQSGINLTHKINQFNKIQRELHRLKFQLRLKKKLYDQTQYRNISKRLGECLTYFERLKTVMVKEEADRVLGKKVHSNRSKTQMSRYEDHLGTQDRLRNRNIVEELLKEQGNYRLQFNQQEQKITRKQYVAIYDLQPISNKLNKSKERTIKRVQNPSTERYVSTFQRKIKEQLNNLTVAKDQSVQSFDSLLKKHERAQNRAVKMKGSRKLVSLPSHGPQKQGLNNQKTENNSYSLDRHKIQRQRQISERGKDQIRRIINYRGMDSEQKNRILRKFYQKYSQMQGQSALDLMCMASMARADLLCRDS